MHGPLGAEEITFYRDNGYLVPQLRLAPEKLSDLREMAQRLIDRNPQLHNRPIQAPHLRSTGGGRGQTSGEIVRYATLPRLLDAIEQLIGPDLILWTTTLFHKTASGPATPWHQDARYWPMDPMVGASYWIAITESTPDNACMRVIPGSHRDYARHVKDAIASEFSLTLAPDAFDESQAVDIVLEPGQMLLFDPFIIHASHPNKGIRERTGFSARFMPSTSWFNHDNEYEGKIAYADRALMLVRGENRCPRNDLARNHPEPAPTGR